ncbi:App1 family protein [Ideonella sp.]|uniref:phosphatidate phosphatase App1 family protein n=1 Tax=Ideonella sp. TaxID=1929293 RepID=UPI0035AF3784
MHAWRAFVAATRTATRTVMQLCGIALAGGVVASCAQAEGLERGDLVMFAPAQAAVTSPGQWTVFIQGRVFESPAGKPGRQALIDALAPVLGADRANPIYRERAGQLVSDSAGGTEVSVLLAGRVFDAAPSDAAGVFSLDVALTDDEIARASRQGVVPFETLPTRRNPQRFQGQAVLVPPQGLTVVTDMDDTIKETNVNDRTEAKANTFVRPFRPVAGMPALYRAWQAASGGQIHFHLVSAGPWQLHAPLRRFTEEAGFPAFTWDMRSIDITDPRRLIDETVHADPARLFDFKVARIRALMARWPARHVVLVGDSGERDPEVYATIASEFADRVDAVFIRNVTGEPSTAPRYTRLFADASTAAKLTVFTDPAQLPRRLAAR